MKDLQGVKTKGSTRYDRVSLDTYNDRIEVYAYDGAARRGEAAGVTSATARKIAAELLRLADEIDAAAKATA